jgi:hypothetical protein
MLRQLLPLLLVVGLMGLLTGCSGKEEPKAKKDDPKAKKEGAKTEATTTGSPARAEFLNVVHGKQSHVMVKPTKPYKKGKPVKATYKGKTASGVMVVRSFNGFVVVEADSMGRATIRLKCDMVDPKSDKNGTIPDGLTVVVSVGAGSDTESTTVTDVTSETDDDGC